jgi:cell division protein FtsI (penicillin-binding protein 3)
MVDRIVKARYYIVYTTIFICFAVVMVRLVDLMVVDRDKLVEKAKSQRTAMLELPVRRGTIYDRVGRRMAVNIEQNSVYCYKNLLKADEGKLSQLSRIMELDQSRVRKILASGKNFVWLKRKVSDEAVEQLKELKVRGVGIKPEARRHYMMGPLAAHVVGFVDIDNKGLEGVEAAYNTTLMNKGENPYVQVGVDARGNLFYNETKSEIAGDSIVLTLDQGLQYIVEKELDEAMTKWNAASATVVMMDPATGDILAMANRPTFDPNEAGRYGPGTRRNRAITDAYEPGSTFKLVTAAAAIEEKLVNPRDKFDCSKGFIEVGGKNVKDAHKHGVLNFMEVIQKSSNVGTIMIAMKVGKQRLYKYIKAFGFGDKTGVDLPGEISGWISPPDRWSGTSIGAVPIGQEVAITPLQLLTAYSMVANGGFKITPRIVKGVIGADGKTVEQPLRQAARTPGQGEVGSENAAPQAPQRVVSERTVEILKKALSMVTEEEGTAKYATVNGNKVAGKTGTAQMYDRAMGRYSPTDFVSTFVGFVPVEKPAFAMIVAVWKPRGEIYGGLVSAPVFSNIAEKALAYLNIPREEQDKKNLLVVDNRPIGRF